MKKALVFFLVAATILGVSWFSRMDSGEQISTEQTIHFVEDERFPIVRPLEPVTGLSSKAVALGKRLFFDTRLSSNNTISCASCHRFDLGGADGMAVSIGVNGALGDINAPTVFNSGLNFAQFWDARAPTLTEQIEGPIHNPVEMNSSWQEIIQRLSSDNVLVAEFNAAYQDGLTVNNLINAIATFEQSLVTLDAPFDRYLRGDKSALTAEQVLGFQNFHDYGCTSCHQGMLLGGNTLQKLGIIEDYFAGREITSADLGRYNVTGREEDKHVFKVPSLRNVALTAPYLHDGSAQTLEAAVAIMARYQLGRDIPTEDLQSIVAFLQSLSGKIPEIGATP